MNKVKFVLFSAGISLAMAFTFSCSSDDSGGGDSFDVNSQVYNRDGTPYTGDGVINIEVIGDVDVGVSGPYNRPLINAGSVTNGIAKLELPETIPNEYLETAPSPRCTASPKDIKVLSSNFVLTNNNKKFRLFIVNADEQKKIAEYISYFYSSKAGKITCNIEEEDYKSTTTANVKAGWNKMYGRRSYAAGNEVEEWSTKNILTKEVRWTLVEDERPSRPPPEEPSYSSSSMVPSSSSSFLSSSSSEMRSSSSYLASCVGFVDGTKREHYGMEKEQFCDSRDGKKYVYVEIGTQIWMAENLNYATSDSKCNEDNYTTCRYDWATAMGLDRTYNSVLYSAVAKHKGICPSGWHIPSNNEWTVLGYLIDLKGSKLKATSGWSSPGTDDYGFAALPTLSGGGISDYWSATEYDALPSSAYNRTLLPIEGFFVSSPTMGDGAKKDNLYSIRCVKD